MKNSFVRLFLIVAFFVSALSAHASGPLLYAEAHAFKNAHCFLLLQAICGWFHAKAAKRGC